MTTARDRKDERTARIVAARTERERKAAAEAMHATLGDALAAALGRYLATRPDRTMPVERALSMIGYSDELKKLIARCIGTNPVMEPAFLKIAELAYECGGDAAREDELDYQFEE